MKDKKQEREKQAIKDAELTARLRAPLGLEYEDETTAPPVDRQRLLRLVRNELPDQEARAVYAIVDSFRSWTLAHDEIVVDEFNRWRAAKSPSPRSKQD